MSNKRGFSLLELIIVMAIIGILAVLGFSNYLNAIKSGKDAKRKTDLQSIQKALEIYYQDNQEYPLPVSNAVPATGTSFCHPDGCDVATYLQALPTHQGGTPYAYASDGTYYQLYACIENPNDNSPGVKQTGYTMSCGTGRCNPCRFGLSSTNSTP